MRTTDGRGKVVCRVGFVFELGSSREKRDVGGWVAELIAWGEMETTEGVMMPKGTTDGQMVQFIDGG